MFVKADMVAKVEHMVCGDFLELNLFSSNSCLIKFNTRSFIISSDINYMHRYLLGFNSIILFVTVISLMFPNYDFLIPKVILPNLGIVFFGYYIQD